MLKKINIQKFTELNNTFYAALAYVYELIGTNKLPKTKREPCWRIWLKGKLNELSRELDFMNNLLEEIKNKKKHKDRLERKQYSKKETQHCKGRSEATNQCRG